VPARPPRHRGRGHRRRHELPRSPTRSATRSTRASRSGPLVSAVQRERVRGYIQKGIDEGRHPRSPAAPRAPRTSTGLLREAHRVRNVTRDMTIAQEEIFGPVLSIMPYDTSRRRRRIANDTIYGLAGGVWGADATPRPWPVDPRTGQVEVNGGALQRDRPVRRLQAVAASAASRPFGLEEFLETKPVFHSARWDHDRRPHRPRRGRGRASGPAPSSSCPPGRQGRSASLTLFQRSANYVAPKPDAPFSAPGPAGGSRHGPLRKALPVRRSGPASSPVHGFRKGSQAGPLGQKRLFARRSSARSGRATS
jgi:hypothetical protein